MFQARGERVPAAGQCPDHYPVCRVEVGQKRSDSSAQPARHLVPLHGGSHRLPHHQSDSRAGPCPVRRPPRVHHEVSLGRAVAMLHRRPELRRQSHPVLRRKHRFAPAGSGSQAPPALAPPARNDRPARARAHAQPKTVHSCSPTVVGLKGPFAFGHGSNSLYIGHLVASRTVLQSMRKLTQLPLVSSSSRWLPGAHPAGSSRRIAAVSPTFGRLFEGTDPDTAGQTPSHLPSSFTVVTAVTGHQCPSRTLWAMFQNGWPPTLKPVSFAQCRFRLKRHPSSPTEPSHQQHTAGAWSHRQHRTSTRHRSATKRPTVLSTPVDNTVDSSSSDLSTLDRAQGGFRR
ncbi:MAG: hypothetical protein QOH57_1133 [Mycobacterium sp.]|nr:hypothetical protein [Mycobacterium sp.]